MTLALVAWLSFVAGSMVTGWLWRRSLQRRRCVCQEVMFEVAVNHQPPTILVTLEQLALATLYGGGVGEILAWAPGSLDNAIGGDLGLYDVTMRTSVIE